MRLGPTASTVCLALVVACGDDARRAPADAVDALDAGDTAAPDSDGAPDDGAQEVIAPPVGRVVINEIDCRADPEEWVELVNVGDAPVELDGYRVSDRPGSGGRGVDPGQLAPGAFRVVHGDFGIACGVDGVYLSVDGRAADQAPPRRGDPEVSTWGRVPDGSGPFAETAATPLHPNVALADLRGTLFATPDGAGTLPVIDLYVDGDAEDTLRAPEKVYAPALWQWTDVSGTSAPQRVDIRIKGSITLRPWDEKPSLKVHFARHDGPGPRSFRGAKKLSLHNLSYDPSGIREWLSYEIMRERGQPAPRVGWAEVRVNGVSKHLYAVVETYDEVFLDDWYRSTEDLYEADGDFSGGGLAGFTLDEGDSLDPLVRIGDRVIALAGAKNATSVMPEVDWVQLAGMFGLEDLLQHSDGMRAGCHNYFMHFDKQGRWTFLPWSVDLALLEGYGGPGPIGSCSTFAHLCDDDAQCAAWFERARDEAAQTVLRGDFRARAEAMAERIQPFAWPADEPWGAGDFWGDKTFDLPAQADAAVDILEARARGIRCATAAERTGQPEHAAGPDDDPTCGGFLIPAKDAGGGPKPLLP